ncbi:MAG TPA: ribonuclease R, partial [Magnetospirillum sp.]|nr:ribonuclease R [Magnetospirillum sp.]
GLVPVSTLPEDFYVHDEVHHALVGKRTRRQFQLGQMLDVVLHEANQLTGSMLFRLQESEPARASNGNRPRARLAKPDKKGGFNKGRGRS